MKKRFVVKLLPLAATLFIAACAGTKLNNDGTPNGDIYWPNPDDVTMDHHKGTFPNLENLTKIRSGMTRDQLYDLIGRPHFTEGFHVREWTYLFYFNTPGKGTNGVSTCQYKVLFDKDKYARSFFWKAIDPEDGVCPAGPAKYILSADALFAFDKSGLNDIKAEGHAELNELLVKLKDLEVLNHITVKGYTDRLGSAAYNRELSQYRADTVRSYLIKNGIEARIVSAEGYGKSNPLVECDNANRDALIACLSPNRRVEVEVDGYGVKASSGSVVPTGATAQ